MSNVDLSALRLDPAPMARRPRGPRVLVAVALALVLGVGATFVWPLLHPGRAVRMAAVRSVPIAGSASTAATAEAVGWVEADPFPVVVRPLVAGRIESIAVLEGATVTAGETVVAKLAGAPLLAAKERAAASCAERERMADAAAAALALAVARREQCAEPRRTAAAARADLAGREAKLAVATAAATKARAEARGASAAATAQEQLAAAGSSNDVALARARAAAEAAAAAATAAEAEATGAANERDATAAIAALADELAARPVDLDGAVKVAEADLQRAKANCNVGRTDLAIAERELGWATVTAPVSGVVQRLLAQPGSPTGPDGDGILSIYDPAHLRARIDVPLGSITGVAPDQEVELRSEVTGATVVKGIVQRIQHEADLLKNTLQVKVRIVDPPPIWRPEMLCRARFLGGRAPTTASSPAMAFLVPKAALRDGAVFVFDPARRVARVVPVTKVEERGDDVVVHGDLSPAQRVVLGPVAADETIREEAP